VPGIRQQKKERTRNEILAAAKQLFIEKGYDEVAMTDIAQAALVGTGTLYNYFKSKDEIFMAAVDWANAVEIDFEVHSYVIQSGVHAVDIVLDYLNKVFEQYKWLLSRPLMKSMLKALVNTVNISSGFTRMVIKEDLKIIKDLAHLLDNLKQADLFSGDPEKAAEVIYASIIYEWMFYVYTDHISDEQLWQSVEDKIRMVLTVKE
jgi:AcrR family transcriptional regulator